MFKWLVKKQLAKFGDRWGYDTGYVREIVDDAGIGAVMPLQALQKLGSFRKVPLDAYYGAALTAGKNADCGPCLQLGVKMAEVEGVKPQQSAPSSSATTLSARRMRCSASSWRSRRWLVTAAAKKHARRFCAVGAAPDLFRWRMPSSARKPIPLLSTLSATGIRA
jgi:hypothetical protein